MTPGGAEIAALDPSFAIELLTLKPDFTSQISPRVRDDLSLLPEIAAKRSEFSLAQLVIEQGAECILRNEIQLDAVNEEIADGRTELDQLRVLFNVGEKAVAEISAGLKDNEVVRERIAKDGNRVCHYGDVLIGECSYVKNRHAPRQNPHSSSGDFSFLPCCSARIGRAALL